METIEIREETFRASIPLDQLINYPVGQLRTLFKMILKNDFEEANREAVLVLNEWIPRELDTAKAAWAKASKEYADGWKSIPCPYGQPPEVKAEIKAQKDINRRLTSAVIRTRNYYNAIQKLQKNYLQVKQDDKRRYKNV